MSFRKNRPQHFHVQLRLQWQLELEEAHRHMPAQLIAGLACRRELRRPQRLDGTAQRNADSAYRPFGKGEYEVPLLHTRDVQSGLAARTLAGLWRPQIIPDRLPPHRPLFFYAPNTGSRWVGA